MTIAGAVPTVAGDFVGFANPARREHDGFGAENPEASAFPIVTKRADHTLAVLQQRQDANLHVDLYALMHAMILERPNHLQAGAIAHMRESWIFVAAKVSL